MEYLSSSIHLPKVELETGVRIEPKLERGKKSIGGQVKTRQNNNKKTHTRNK